MARVEFARYGEHPKFCYGTGLCGVLVSVCALCSMFQVCFRFDPESCHEFKLQTKRRGEEETHEDDKTRQGEAREGCRRQETRVEETKREERSLFLSPSGRHRRRCDQSRRMSRID